MTTSIAGRVAVVTGASRGLGRAIVAALVADGAQVALLARPSRSLDETATSFGDAVLACPCDIRSAAAVHGAIEQAVRRFSRLDILVNNAAACLVNKIESVPDEDVRTEIETNFMAPIWCSRAVIPHMKAAGGGDIVNISSESVNAVVPYMTNYAATKAALETFSFGLRDELRPYGVRVTVLRSGAMETSIVDQWSEAQKQAFFSAFQDSPRQAQTGRSIDPAITARALLNILKLPAEASMRLVELGGK